MQLKYDIIRESCSELSSPVVVVKKKDGTDRICIDYRRLNQRIIKDHFPMPIIDKQLEKLSEAKVFTTLDLRNGFFHVPFEDQFFGRVVEAGTVSPSPENTKAVKDFPVPTRQHRKFSHF